jgi:hypothetical protein
MMIILSFLFWQGATPLRRYWRGVCRLDGIAGARKAYAAAETAEGRHKSGIACAQYAPTPSAGSARNARWSPLQITS